jgi:hypothetical protein
MTADPFEEWKTNPWKFTESAIQTLKVAAIAQVRNPNLSQKDKDLWFELMLVEITDPLREWWEHLNETGGKV